MNNNPNPNKWYYLVQFKDMPLTIRTQEHIVELYKHLKLYCDTQSSTYTLSNIAALPYDETQQETAYGLEEYESYHSILDVEIDDDGLKLLIECKNNEDNFNMIDANQLIRFYHPNNHGLGGAKIAKIAVGYSDIAPIQFIKG